jgi:glycosyltransferase involved in cell wall biosynthesis
MPSNSDDEILMTYAPATDDVLPGVAFAMRHTSQTGLVWNSMARTYDRVAELLSPARSYLAFPRLDPDPAYRPRVLEPIEGDFYSTAGPNRPNLAALIRKHRLRVVIYMACAASEVSLGFLRGQGVRTINYEQFSHPPDARQSAVRRFLKHLAHSYMHYNIHDSYMANSEHMRQFLLSFAGLPPSRVYTVINGVDTGLFCPGPGPNPTEYGLPRTQHYALSICQARPEKRVEFLIEVAARVFALRPEISLTFVHVGGGRCLPAWQAKAEEMGLAGRFFFLGSRNDVVSLHRLASMFIHAADRESFGLVLAESMATAKPVIATEASGPREIVADGETGYLIRKEDLEGFVKAILRLVDEPAVRARLGQRALNRTHALFSLERQAQDMHLVIRNCLGAG